MKYGNAFPRSKPIRTLGLSFLAAGMFACNQDVSSADPESGRKDVTQEGGYLPR